MKRGQFLILAFLLCLNLPLLAQHSPRKDYAAGDTIIGYTAEGEPFKAKIISTASMTASVGVGGYDSCMVMNHAGRTITLPDSVQGFKLTQIAQYAFRRVKADSIRLPAQLTTISASAFLLAEIDHITFPSKVNNIGAAAFGSATLTEVVLPKSLLILGNNAFSNCQQLRRVELNPAIITFNASVFANDSSLTEVVLPEGLKNLGQYTFRNCVSLEEITLPSTIRTIGSYLFTRCEGLKRVHLDGLTVAGSYMFNGCTALEEITLPASLVMKGTTADHYLFAGCTALKRVSMEGVNMIGANMFEGCTALESFHVPASVMSIGEYAFKGCTGLRQVTFAEGTPLTTLGQYCFEGCGFEEFVYPEGITTTGSYSFRNNLSLRMVTLPTTLTSTGTSTFGGCPELTTVKTTRPEPGECVASTFSECVDKAMLLVPTGSLDAYRNKAGWKAFKKIEEELDLPDGSVFKGLSQQGDTITATVVSNEERTCIIGDGINPATQTDINGPLYIPSKLNVYTVVGIAANAFKGQKGITSVSLPEEMRSVGDNAFSGCTALEKIVIPSTLNNIGNDVFAGCPNIIDITAKSTQPQAINATFFDEQVFAEAMLFAPKGYTDAYAAAEQWKRFSHITEQLNKGDRFLYADDGLEPEACYQVLDNDLHTCQLSNRGNTSLPTVELDVVGTLNIPEKVNGWTVTAIGGSVLQKHEGVKKVVIPSTVKSIASAAFLYAYGLKEVVLPEGIATIASSAFSGCRNLKKLTLPKSVTRIETRAFAGTALYHISLPKGLTYIGSYALDECSNLKSITAHGSPATPWMCITTDTANVRLHVDAGQLDAYRSAEIWQGFEHIDELGSGIPITAEYFPDEALRDLLTDRFGDVLTDDEVAETISLYIYERGISNLKGIEWLHRLEFLESFHNSIDSLDLTGCPLLQVVSVGDNGMKHIAIDGLDELNVIGLSSNKFTQFTLPALPSLEVLDLSDNQLTTFDATPCPTLRHLNVNDNHLTSLRVNRLGALKELYADNNSLTSLDVTTCTALQNLSANNNRIASINVTKASALGSLCLSDNLLTEINLSNNPQLVFINLANNSLRAVNTSNKPNLQVVNVKNNRIFALDLSTARQLIAINVDGNQLTYLDLYACGKLTDADRIVLGTQHPQGNGMFITGTRQAGAAVHPYTLAADVENIQFNGSTISKGHIITIEKTPYLIFAENTDAESIEGQTFTYDYNTEIPNLPDLRMHVSYTVGSVATGIQTIDESASKQVDEFWYTLDGQQLTIPPTQKGIYIKGGKKVIVR